MYNNNQYEYNNNQYVYCMYTFIANRRPSFFLRTSVTLPNAPFPITRTNSKSSIHI